MTASLHSSASTPLMIERRCAEHEIEQESRLTSTYRFSLHPQHTAPLQFDIHSLFTLCTRSIVYYLSHSSVISQPEGAERRCQLSRGSSSSALIFVINHCCSLYT